MKYCRRLVPRTCSNCRAAFNGRDDSTRKNYFCSQECNRHYQTVKAFWLLIAKPAMGCWEYQGKREKRSGYGQGGQLNGKKGAKAHRKAYQLVFGVVLETAVYVLHKCDNPPCCRPSHLFLGSQADNIHDAMRKGRHKKPPIRRKSSAK